MATLEQIAKAAGVSKMTVSNVLNGRNKELWPTAIERATHIRRLAEEMGYRPNAAARAIGRGRFNNVAMVLGQSAQYMPDGLLRGAAQALAERDMSLSITELPDTKLVNAEYVPKILRELSSDGLLINYIQNVPKPMEPLLRSNRIPSVWLNRKGSTDSVYPDDVGGARVATEHLLRLGHRRIVFLGWASAEHYSESDRRDGYESAMREAGLSPRIETSSWSSWRKDMMPATPETRIRDAAALLAGPDRPTAVVTTAAALAHPLIYAAVAAGLRVPADLSVVTFHDWVPDAMGLYVGFMRIPMTLVGATAVGLLARKIEDPSAPLPSIPVQETFNPGQTVAPPA